MATIMFDVGCTLSKIAAHRFPASGFFDRDLNISNNMNREDYRIWGKDCLLNPTVLSNIDANAIVNIKLLLDKFVNFFPSELDTNLVHGDFDPANILVDNINGVWKITGILDWEFAFSGSVLSDVANMLRYAHLLPADFTTEFLRGLKSGGIVLPENWRISCDLLNLVALLDCLTRTDPGTSPIRCSDICSLIQHITNNLEQY